MIVHTKTAQKHDLMIAKRDYIWDHFYRYTVYYIFNKYLLYIELSR